MGCVWQTAVLLAIAALGFAAAFLLTGNRGAVPLSNQYAASRRHATGVQPPLAPSYERPVNRPSDDTQTGHKATESSPAPDTKVASPVTGESESAVKPTQPAAPSRPSRSALDQWNEVSHGSRSSARIALTFDAGAGSSPTPDILAVLAKHNVRCTFFLTGKWIEKNPALVRRIAAEGHELGNHTYSHRRLTGLSDGAIAGELSRVENQVMRLIGRSTKPLARVPFGSRNKRVLQTMAREGYRSIFWDLDSWDSVKVGITSDQIRQRVLERVQNGSIVLMHCGSKATTGALDSLLEKLEASGYQPVTISELIGG
jgi:peptidoglycan/xylan/chitin deacetylase (PgdA/CDA1 family)